MTDPESDNLKAAAPYLLEVARSSEVRRYRNQPKMDALRQYKAEILEAHRQAATARPRLASTLTDPTELSVQRWYIDSFRVDGFEALRHECANAAMVVYPSLSHTRSRELFDVTMLEVRRVLYGDFKRREPIIAGRLLGIRSAWMARYAPLMNADEFTKFTVLMRNLAPAVSRKNIELILYGDPDAVPLFK